ncbi:MAG TPA: hypothetical protein VMZ28_24230 [Kofleriaceae bacterium]|nr:hypothetical protein [Kofleriaceae bacterium]
MLRLLALHGQTLNGAFMRQELAWLETPGVELVCPDGPVACDEGVVDRLYSVWDAPRQPPPHRAWWDATDDGRVYRGWEATRDLLAPLLEPAPVAILGFSQGAILATALAALAQNGELPPIDRVVLIGGRPPRADLLAPFLAEPIRLPSLHVWGENDLLARDTSRELVDRFDPATRVVATWPGGHAIPSTGPAASAIDHFVARA